MADCPSARDVTRRSHGPCVTDQLASAPYSGPVVPNCLSRTRTEGRGGSCHQRGGAATRCTRPPFPATSPLPAGAGHILPSTNGGPRGRADGGSSGTGHLHDPTPWSCRAHDTARLLEEGEEEGTPGGRDNGIPERVLLAPTVELWGPKWSNGNAAAGASTGDGTRVCRAPGAGEQHQRARWATTGLPRGEPPQPRTGERARVGGLTSIQPMSRRHVRQVPLRRFLLQKIRTWTVFGRLGGRVTYNMRPVYPSTI